MIITGTEEIREMHMWYYLLGEGVGGMIKHNRDKTQGEDE